MVYLMTKYIIGVDNGSTSSKIVIYDLEGNIVCEAKEDLKPMHLAVPGVVEHPDDNLWDSIISASQKAMEQFSGNKADIIGLGLCTIRCCRVLLRGDGSLASPVMSWMDARLARPYEHTDPSVQYVTTTSGYITHRLTGEFNDTAANYEGEWPIDKDHWQWSEDQEVLKKYNIPREMLFDLQMPGAISGYVTDTAAIAMGIPAGIPVIATANDKAVEVLGAGLIGDKTALISLGTYIGGMVNGFANLKDTTSCFSNLASIPHRYLFESYGIRRGMWTVNWIKELFGDEIALKSKVLGMTPEEYLSEKAEKIPAGSDGLMTVLDWLAPTDKPYRKGVMIGFDGRHSREHMFRSILEGIALTMKNHMDYMCQELNIELENIIVSGGGSNSRLMMQIIADVFELPTYRNVVNGSASLGAAICVAVALGVYENFETAISKMVKVRDSFEPIHAHVAVYQRLNHEVYQNITVYTDEVLKQSYPIFG
jgi:sugar (pentulose or hexulose) kinase